MFAESRVTSLTSPMTDFKVTFFMIAIRRNSPVSCFYDQSPTMWWIVLIGLDPTLETENKLSQLMEQYHD